MMMRMSQKMKMTRRKTQMMKMKIIVIRNILTRSDVYTE